MFSSISKKWSAFYKQLRKKTLGEFFGRYKRAITVCWIDKFLYNSTPYKHRTIANLAMGF